jgi:hypothetical protein
MDYLNHFYGLNGEYPLTIINHDRATINNGIDYYDGQ